MQRVEAPTDRVKRRRATWPVAVHRMSESVEPLVFGTPESRLRAVGELTEQCWALAGKRLPTYARHEVPVRIVRLSRQDDPAT